MLGLARYPALVLRRLIRHQRSGSSVTIHIWFERVSRARTPARLRIMEESMLNVDLSIRDGDGLAVVALRGELTRPTPPVASHLITAVAVCGPSVIVDLTGLQGIGYSGLSVLLRIRKWTRKTPATCLWWPRSRRCAGSWKPLA